MRKKDTHQALKDGRKGGTGMIITVVIVIMIILGGAGAAIFLTGYFAEQVMESAGVSVQVNLLGDDIVVDIVGGKNVDKLRYVYLIVEDCDLPDEVAAKRVIDAKTQIVYEGIAYSLRGNLCVGVRGYFEDGTSHLLTQKSFRFT